MYPVEQPQGCTCSRPRTRRHEYRDEGGALLWSVSTARARSTGDGLELYAPATAGESRHALSAASRTKPGRDHLIRARLAARRPGSRLAAVAWSPQCRTIVNVFERWNRTSGRTAGLSRGLRPGPGAVSVRRGRPAATSTSSPAPARSTTGTTTPDEAGADRLPGARRRHARLDMSTTAKRRVPGAFQRRDPAAARPDYRVSSPARPAPTPSRPR